MEEAILGKEMWLEQYLTDDRNVPAERLNDTACTAALVAECAHRDRFNPDAL